MTEIVIPSKWDIIPIHTSDRATFKSCRRKWNWSSPARNNLVRKVGVYGIYPPFWFGTGIHKAIEKYYDPAYGEDIVVAFETWFNHQVNGGYITEAELDEHSDREPSLQENGLYWVKGLSDLLINFDSDEFDEYLKLGKGMLTYYQDYAAKNDNFTVIAVEQEFSVPLTDKDGNVLYMPDSRVMPEQWEFELDIGGIPENIYGPWIKWDNRTKTVLKQVHARGRIDLLIQDNESGFYGIRDWKTASRVDDDYFRHLDLDEQVTTYSWAAEQTAYMFNQPYTLISFLDYVALLKAYPRPPTLTSRGLLSVDKQKESTTAEMFAEAIEVLNQQYLFQTDEKYQNYYTWLLETEDKRFINVERVRRNKHQKYNCGRRLYFEARDMLAPDIAIYPNPTKDYGCLNCHFRPPCVMVEDGSDYKVLLTDGYVKNHDR